MHVFFLSSALLLLQLDPSVFLSFFLMFLSYVAFSQRCIFFMFFVVVVVVVVVVVFKSPLFCFLHVSE